MSRNRSHVLRAAVPAAALVVAAGALTGCGSGKDTSTMKVRTNAAQGASAEAGDIVVRNVYVAPQTGGQTASPGAQGATTAYVVATVGNSGGSATDQLTGVTVDGVQATPNRAEGSTSATAAATVEASATASASGSAPASASATPTPSASASSAASQPSTEDLTLLPHHVISFVDPGAGAAGLQLVVDGLPKPVQAGQFAAVTFTFAKAGSITVQAPVQPTTGTTEAATPMPSVSLETTTPKAREEGSG